MADLIKPPLARSVLKPFSMAPSENQKHRSKLSRQPEPEAISSPLHLPPVRIETVLPRRRKMKKSGHPHAQ